MALLALTHPSCLEHDAGSGHPERRDRIPAVVEGLKAAGLGGDLRWVEPRPATRTEIERVHPAELVGSLERFCEAGGGRIDADTAAGPASFDAALVAAGAVVEATERLAAGEADAAFCAVRPPGHHATPTRPMGFCLFNGISVAAAALADAGERVLVLDWDVHHGNGTQEVFWADGRVLYASWHQWPLYPGTGRAEEVGEGPGLGLTVNVPLPPGATGDVYLRALGDVMEPVIDGFSPTWVLVSCGFDAHRDDPLSSMGLSAGDFGELAARAASLVARGRCVLVLEGGYDLGALRRSATSSAQSLGGLAVEPPEALTSGGPGAEAVGAAQRARAAALAAG